MLECVQRGSRTEEGSGGQGIAEGAGQTTWRKGGSWRTFCLCNSLTGGWSQLGVGLYSQRTRGRRRGNLKFRLDTRRDFFT